MEVNLDLFKIIGVSFATLIASLVVKQYKPEMAVIIGMAGGIVVIILTVNALMEVLEMFNVLVNKSGLDGALFGSILKIIGIGYLTEFSASICNDAGSSSMGDKILFGGKIIILAMALPIITSVINIITELLP